MIDINKALENLSHSKFRSSFYLNKKEKDYYLLKGEDVIRSHVRDFVRERLSPKNPINDGKQTPFSGHPAFKAMHACACCCRGCLNKWYKIPKDIDLDNDTQENIVNLLMTWIKRKI